MRLEQKQHSEVNKREKKEQSVEISPEEGQALDL